MTILIIILCVVGGLMALIGILGNVGKKKEKPAPNIGPSGYGGYLGTYKEKTVSGRSLSSSRSYSSPVSSRTRYRESEPDNSLNNLTTGLIIGSMMNDSSDHDRHSHHSSSHDSGSWSGGSSDGGGSSSSWDSGSSDSGSSYDSGSSSDFSSSSSD